MVRGRTGEFVSKKDVLTAAVGMTAHASRPAKVTSVVDLRGRLKERFPHGYVGNLCIAPTREVCAEPSFDDYALAVRGCITDATAEGCAVDLNARRGLDPAQSWPRSLDACIEGGLMQDSWAGPANYEVDFGAGSADWLDLPDFLPPGLTLLMPDPERRGRVYAIVALERARHRRLEEAAGKGAPVERGSRLLQRFAG